jgi:hypothetical protein
MKIAA